MESCQNESCTAVSSEQSAAGFASIVDGSTFIASAMIFTTVFAKSAQDSFTPAKPSCVLTTASFFLASVPVSPLPS
eukprot:UN27206